MAQQVNDSANAVSKKAFQFVDTAYVDHMKADFVGWVEKTLNTSEKISEFVYIGVFLLVIILLAVIANFITKKIILKVIQKLVAKSKTQWDDMLLDKKFLNKVTHIVPALILFLLLPIALQDYPQAISITKNAILVYMVIMVLLAIDALINGFHAVYKSLPMSKGKSIKSFVQVGKIIFYFIGGIAIISILLNKEIGAIFAGLGAMAAVLMLVFKDSILGLVGGVQLSSNDMVRVGDWISMPSRNADGDVIEISLNTVKVQNFDKTITTIPTYSLVNESFTNWRGMQESGGRRIRRHILIDTSSIKLCTPEMIHKFKKIQVLKDYIEKKQKELEEFNKSNNIDNSVVVNGRRMTNIGTFRAYLTEYLKNHPAIYSEGMTFLLRQLQPTETGLPLEIYVFTKTTNWVEYESIQADVFDHVLATAKEFDLKVFQNPTGFDFQQLAN